MMRGQYQNELNGGGGYNENSSTNENVYYNGGGGGMESSNQPSTNQPSSQSRMAYNKPPESSSVSNPNGLSFVWGGNSNSSASSNTKSDVSSYACSVSGQQSARSGGSGNWQQQPAAYVQKNNEKPMSTYMQEDSNMMWTNPYPKKKAEPDNGTSVWGNPSNQGPIKRWKEPVILPPEKPSALDKEKSKSDSNSNTQSSSSSSAVQPASSTPVNDDVNGSENHTTASENSGVVSASSCGWGDTVNRSATPVQNKLAIETTANVGYSCWGGRSDPKPLGWDFAPSESTMTDQPFRVSDQNQPFPSTRSMSYIGAERQSAIGDTIGLNGFGQQNGGYTSQQQLMPSTDYFNGPSFATSTTTSQLTATLTKALSQIGAPRSRGPLPPSTMSQPHQLAELLKRAISAGFLEPTILQVKLSPEQLELLNSCLANMARLENAKKNFDQVSYPSQQHKEMEWMRLENDKKQMLFMMGELKRTLQFQQQSANGGIQQPQQQPFSVLGNTTQSKLEQWKRGGSSLGMDTNSIFPEPVEPSYTNTGSMWSSTNVTDNGADWSALANAISRKQNQMESTKEYTDEADDAAINAVVDDITHEPSEVKPATLMSINRTSTPVNNDSNSTTTTAATMPATNASTRSTTPKENALSTMGVNERSNMVTPTLGNTFDADVPEFKPGQPWLWRDPKELAQDPEATPASFIAKKPTLFNSASANGNGMMGANSATVYGMNGGMTTFDYANSAEVVYPKIAPNGYLPSTTRAAAWMKHQQPLPQDSWASMVNSQPRGPPLQVVHPIPGIPTAPARMVPYSAIKPGTPASGPYIVPYNSLGYGTQPWVVLTNLGLMDEQQLQIMMSHIAPLNSCIFPPGAGFAAIRFKESSPLEKILPRLNHECSARGMVAQVAKDEEISSLLQCVNPVPLGPTISSATMAAAGNPYYADASTQRGRNGWGVPVASTAQSYGLLPPAYQQVSTIRHA